MQDKMGIAEDVASRFRYGWMKWKKVTVFLYDKKGPLKVKGKFYNTVLRSGVMYGSECQALNKRDEMNIGGTEVKC